MLVNDINFTDVYLASCYFTFRRYLSHNCFSQETLNQFIFVLDIMTNGHNISSDFTKISCWNMHCHIIYCLYLSGQFFFSNIWQQILIYEKTNTPFFVWLLLLLNTLLHEKKILNVWKQTKKKQKKSINLWK